MTGRIALIVTLSAYAPASAQAVGDTVYYRERTRTETTLRMPQASMTMTHDHDAVIGFVRLAADSAHAWYERLSLVTAMPTGGIDSLDTADALHRPFVLRIDPRNHVTALATPTFPAAFVTNLSRQFDDFLMPRPEGSIGEDSRWTDSTVTEDAGFRATKSGRYEVVGDTVLGGVPAFKIQAAVQQRWEVSADVQGQPGLRAVSRTEGLDEGTFYTAKAGGHLLGRSRTARMSGPLEYIGGPQPVRIETSSTYENTIESVERPGP